MLRLDIRTFVCAVATTAVCSPLASAQTTRIINQPDSQVIDTTIRNGPYASINQDGATLLTGKPGISA